MGRQKSHGVKLGKEEGLRVLKEERERWMEGRKRGSESMAVDSDILLHSGLPPEG